MSPNRVEIFGSRVLNEYTSILFSFSSSKVVKNEKSRYERTCAHDSKTLALKLVKLFWIDSQNFIYFSINGHMFKEVWLDVTATVTSRTSERPIRVVDQSNEKNWQQIPEGLAGNSRWLTYRSGSVFQIYRYILHKRWVKGLLIAYHWHYDLLGMPSSLTQTTGLRFEF